MQGHIYQINIKLQTHNECGIPKCPIDSVYVSKKSVGDDYNNYRMRSKNGTNNRTVLIFPLELMNKLNMEDSWQIKPGDLGENFTTFGIKYVKLIPGKKFAIGDKVIIEITEKCNPCSNLKVLPYVGEKRLNEFINTLSGRRGMFAKVISEGMIRKGDQINEIPSKTTSNKG